MWWFIAIGYPNYKPVFTMIGPFQSKTEAVDMRKWVMDMDGSVSECWCDEAVTR